MDKFIVSARKYRPQTFESVVGQDHVTTTLKNAIRNNHLAHAFLFCGPRGVGKTTCARILAKTINCKNQSPEGEACNRCDSCVSFNEGTSLNIHELDAASNNSVDDIRTLVDQVRFAPQAGKYKVYIIDEVHMLSAAAFNAFLKTLEEPPHYAIFILATTEKHKILPTILSRCQIFDFRRITTEDTVDHLEKICRQEKISAEKSALQLIAQKSEGCLRDALTILDKIVSFTNAEVNYANTIEHLNILDADYYFRLFDFMQNQDLAAALLLYDDINNKGFEGDLVINGFAEFIRNLLVCKDERVAGLLETVEGFKKKFASVAKGADTAYLVSALNILNECEINYKNARNKKLHVELAIIKLIFLQQAIELTASGEIAKKKQRDVSVAYKNLPFVLSKKNQESKSSEAEPSAMEAKLTIDTGAIKGKNETGKSESPKLSKLESIRNQYANKVQEAQPEVTTLDAERLRELWNEFTGLLRERKSTAVKSFELAELRVSENSFEVITNNNLEQRFIEQEKRQLSEFLQQALEMKTIQFTITIRENGEQTPVDKPLSKREQFQKIVEEYPLVKELKDRLRLELDY